jgi:hypothetical protein
VWGGRVWALGRGGLYVHGAVGGRDYGRTRNDWLGLAMGAKVSRFSGNISS